MVPESAAFDGDTPVANLESPRRTVSEAAFIGLAGLVQGALSDIGAASFAPSGPVAELVHGSDDRVLPNVNYTSSNDDNYTSPLGWCSCAETSTLLRPAS